MIHLIHGPDPPRNRDFFTRGRRLHNGAEGLAPGSHRVLHILLKNRIELMVVHHALSRDADDEPAFRRAVDVVYAE